MNKVVAIGAGIGGACICIFFVILTACLSVLNFFNTDTTNSDIEDEYVKNNSKYSNLYLPVVSKNIKNNDGYVTLSRIVKLYNENTSFSFAEIYSDNLDKINKQMKPLDEVCDMKKYNNISLCNNINEQDNNLSSKPFSKPIDFSKVTVTSYFMQERIVYGKSDVHGAWDLAASNGTPVYAVCDGIIEVSSFKYLSNSIDKNGGYGNYIKLRCDVPSATYYVIYGHLYPNSSKVKKGMNVSQGKQIASVGTTGYSTGPHLHFEVQTNDKKKVDGMNLINFNT